VTFPPSFPHPRGLLSGRNTIDGDVYTLDPAGDRTAKQDDLAGVTSNYTYDKIYELTHVTQGANTTESYSYDPVGNRLTSLGVPSYTVNSSNELTGTSNASYTYDQNGNTTSKTNSSGTTNYTWDFENRLTNVTLPGSGGTATFKYDPFGRRIQKAFTQNGTTTTTNYVYDGDDVTETTDQSGNVVAKYAQGQSIDEPLAETTSSGTDYYEADGLGSITSLTSGTGTVVQSYTYDSFGNTTHSTGSLTNPFQYTAREFDSETGLYYYRARYYEPTTGRFLSEDPIGWYGEDSNFYRYALNRPSMFIDPIGRTVYLCHRPVHLVGFWSFLNHAPFVYHYWLKTGSKEAGLGAVGEGIPGQNAPPDSPYFTQTEIVGHSGESKAPGASCSEQPHEDEDCVNRELRIGKKEGRFVPGVNDCSALAQGILNDCSTLHPLPPPVPRLMY
jgi:RHS repeat-associated protein